MKNTIAYLLIFVISFAYNYEVICYLSKTAVYISSPGKYDFQDLEKDAEPKESDDKNEKTEKFSFSTDVHSSYNLISYVLTKKLNINQIQNLSSDDYSQTVYSPPEVS